MTPTQVLLPVTVGAVAGAVMMGGLILLGVDSTLKVLRRLVGG